MILSLKPEVVLLLVDDLLGVSHKYDKLMIVMGGANVVHGSVPTSAGIDYLDCGHSRLSADMRIHMGDSIFPPFAFLMHPIANLTFQNR